MERLFNDFGLGQLNLINRLVFPPIKLGRGSPDGTVTEDQLLFYQQIARDGPAVVIIEPVSVTSNGREHPRQPWIHLPESAKELKKIVDVIHAQNRLACLHLNHAGAAAHPKVTGTEAKGPSVINCLARETVSEPLTIEEINEIISGYRSAAEKAVQAGFDLLEFQAGHGYLVSQFLNGKLNQRGDAYGRDRLRFAAEALASVLEGAPNLPLIVRISGSEMSQDFGISPDDLLSFVNFAEGQGVHALHVGMGHACFSPPWYFHHGSLPFAPQTEALTRLRARTSLPLIVAGRMGRRERIQDIMDQGLADLVALGRPLLADPALIKKWRQEDDQAVISCGYCLQGCLHRLKSGQMLGCNLNPEIGRPPLEPTSTPLNVLVAGGGPAGLSAARYLTRRGHHVTLAEKSGHLGGQFALAWTAPGKRSMKEGLDGLIQATTTSMAAVHLYRTVDAALVDQMEPDLLVWAVGARQNIPDIPGLDDQNVMTAVEYFSGEKTVSGPRVLVIGAGRTGLEIAEKLGREGYEVVATKRTDPVGGMTEAVTRNLSLKRIAQMPQVTLMPHTTVKAFHPETVDIEQDGAEISIEPFETVILASGMKPAPGPEETVIRKVARLEVIGDAASVQDIFSAIQAGYHLAQQY
ncbi:MAG: FAD-dependent oxidoreductase [Proteobacteria bacterium]|nr:FAD-dependent oxidoreductase [Pseudomonadota bacterium]